MWQYGLKKNVQAEKILNWVSKLFTTAFKIWIDKMGAGHDSADLAILGLCEAEAGK